MDHLYAYPEHLVIQNLLPGIGERRIGVTEARALIARTPGIVPIGIDPDGAGAVYWADIGDYPFREWQFLFTIDHLAREGQITTSFSTPVDVLVDPEIARRGLAPRGFIFHVSRCGSTLLAKSLARSDENIVINQGGPLQHGFWTLITDNWQRPLEATEENLALFRQLVLAMTRVRAPGQKNAFIKFISWNTLCMDFVAKAFPGIPMIFLYRDAAEVIASVMKNTTAALEARGSAKGEFISGSRQDLDDIAYLSKCYKKYFQKALKAAKNDLRVVNYKDINADNGLEIFARGLGYNPSEAEWNKMRAQFSLYSKDDTGAQTFKSDKAEKRRAITDEQQKTIDNECRELAAELDRCSGNLFPRSADQWTGGETTRV
jgi:hypothetical protein